MKTRRIEITVETYEVLLVRQGHSKRQIDCPDCGEAVPVLKPEEAALAVGDSPRTIYRWVESGRIHFIEGPDGLLFICLNSLIQQRKETLS